MCNQGIINKYKQKSKALTVCEERKKQRLEISQAGKTKNGEREVFTKSREREVIKNIKQLQLL